MASSGQGPGDGASGPNFSGGYKSMVLALLVLAYTFNFIDRTIISTIGQAIKVDLSLTDTQLGLLGGITFAALYTFLGIPIARLAEKKSRVNIIAIAIVVWSGFTALCGTAANFTQLVLYRIGVGVGEAGLSPPAHSLISDYYEPKKRASALAIYSYGIPAGTMFGAIAGGWIAQNVSWQAAFMLVGLPGVMVAIAIKLLIKEPPRGWADRQAALAAEPAGALGREASEAGAPAEDTSAAPTIWAVTKRLFGTWGLFHMIAGITLASFAGYGAGAFVPPLLIRDYGLNLATAGLTVGLVSGISNGGGTLLGGFLTDWAGRRSVRWYALVPAIGLMLATPIYLFGFSQTVLATTVTFWMIGAVLHYTYLGPTFGVIQNAMDTRSRATGVAVTFFVLNMIALGGGPPFTGWLIDHFAQAKWAAAGGLETFKAACPGGVGPKGAAEAVDVACKAAMSGGTRAGVLGVTLVYAWAGLHYFLAAITLPKDLAKLRAS